MRAYEVRPDEDWPQDHAINARCKWGLPGVKCPECGFLGGMIGARYPAFSLPEGVAPSPYLERWPVTPERQKELRAPLLQAWGKDVWLPPGAEFGPLAGSGWGKCGDVAWSAWAMLLTTEAVQRLEGEGVSTLSPVPVEIKWRGKRAPHYFDLQILPTLRLSSSYLERLGASRCQSCGMLRQRPESALPDRFARLAHAELLDNLVLDAPSLPADWDLLRIHDRAATIVASERFRAAAVKLGLTNVTFREVRVEQLLLTC